MEAYRGRAGETISAVAGLTAGLPPAEGLPILSRNRRFRSWQGACGGASRREESSVGRVRFSRSPRARLAQLVVAGVVASAGALAFGAGSAFAGGMVDCAPFGTDTAADVQTAANGGGTVTIFGVCAGT